jgi:hypothetical protein
MNRLTFLFLVLLPVAAPAGIVINEIHCDSEPNPLRSEFVELFNDGESPVDLGGWRFSDGVDYVFPAGTVVPPGGYLAVAEDLAGFRQAYGEAARPQVIAHWHFDETGGTTAADSTGVPNGAGETKTAVASGGVVQSAEGRFGGSGVSIDGEAGSYLTIPPLDALWSGSYTIAAWVKPADTTSNAILADISAPQAFLFSVDTAARMTHRHAAAQPATAAVWTGSGGTITPGTWQHVAAVWDREAQTALVYLNGVPVYRTVVGKMPAELAMVRNARPWHIGRKQDSGDCFNGGLDELWVVRGALPGAAIVTLMNENRVAATQVVDLADLVAGGTGTRPGVARDQGLDAATGEFRDGPGAGDHGPTVPGAYAPVAHPMIDGVFVPNGTLGAGQPVTSTGLTAIVGSGDGDPTPGYWYNGGGLLGDPSKVNGTTTFYLPKYLDEPLTHSVLTAMTQKGITFDLEAIEAAHGGRQAVAFTAVAGDSRLQAGGTVAAIVLVDGVEAFRRTGIASNEQVIDVVLPAGARFLTLIMTNSDGNNTSDHGFFANPFVHLEATATPGSGPLVVGPYAGGLSGDGERLVLRSSGGVVVDEVDYGTEFPWPVAAGGEGSSLELQHPGLDNDLAGSWRSSAGAPTPGARNSVFTENAAPQIRQVGHAPKMPAAGQPMTVSAKVSDPQGVGSVQLHYQLVAPGAYIPAYRALTTAQVTANPSVPRTPNPEFENPARWTTVAMYDNGNGGDATAGDGVFTAQVPGQVNRTLVRYRITAADTAGAQVRVPYADDPSLNFAAFVYNGVPDFVAGTRSVTGQIPYIHPKEVLTSLPVYSLLTTSADLAKCMAYDAADQLPANNFESREAFNWNGTFVYDGEVYDHIRYRLRQRNDRYGGSGKRSFRFRFNRGRYAQLHDFEGVPYPEKWRTLNTHKMSARGGANLGLYEMANSHLWRVFGCPSPSVHWFHFRVVDGVDEAPAGLNGQHLGDFFGLMLALEDYDSRFLSSRGLPDGNIYKLNSYILNGKEVQRFQAADTVTDGSDFHNILNNLRAARPADWLNTYVDYPAWYRYHAVVDAVRHYDVQPNTAEHLKNRAWYFRPDSSNPWGKMITLPWDSDTSWGPNWNGGEDFSKAAAITANKPDFVRDYRNVVREFRDLVWQRDQIEPLLNYFESRVAPFHLADRDRWTGSPTAAGNQTDGAFSAKVADMKRFAFVGGTWEGGSDDPQDAQSKDTGISGREGRDAFLDYLQADPAIPATPTAEYTGAAGYPLNGLTFQTSSFSDPQGDGTFGALEWRLAEYQPNAIQPDDAVMIAAKSEWKFDDTGVDRGTAWRAAGFDDSAWASGPGELGYGETGLGTTLGWGGVSTNRHLTYYFRKQFQVSDPGRFTGFRLGVRRDDGAVVYINGVEVFRTGLPAAPAEITYTTRASSDVNGVNETTYFSTLLPVTALVEGENTIAVEVHQSSPTSADLRFDLTLGGVFPVPPRPASVIWEYEHRWKSPMLTTFAPTITIPPDAVREDRTYRVRVRHRDATGRWSHWSAPVEFTTSQPGIQPLLQNLAVSEIMYDPAPESAAEALAGWTAQDFEWIELENRSATETLDLANLAFTKGVDVTIAPGTTLTPGARCLVVRSATAFALRHGAAGPVVGEFSSTRLNNNGEELKLSYAGGVPVREFLFSDNAPWPEGAKGTGASISFLPAADLAGQGNGLNWRAGPATPGAANDFPAGWAAWAASAFDPLDADFAEVSAPAADPDGDGQENMVEYILGSSPATDSSVGAVQTGVIDDGGQSYLTVSFLLRPDVTTTTETSIVLAGWQLVNLIEIGRVPSSDGSERITYRDVVPLGAGTDRFLRLRVSRP